MTNRRPPIRRLPTRQGATLTEVLMSLMIMGLGITSVFTLFPMSVLRSVKSTNLTHAALLADTARDFYLYRKSILTQPPARITSNVYAHAKDYFLLDPDGSPSNPVPDAQIPEPFVGTFVVDPYGGANAGVFGWQPGRFGEVLRVANQLPTPDLTAVPAIPVDLGVVTAKDSWITAFQDVPTQVSDQTVAGVPVTRLEFTGNLDFNGSVGSASRALVLTSNGRQSLTRNLHATPVPAGTPNAIDVTPRLPRTVFDPMNGVDNVGLVRIQNFERRYTFLLTMHRDELGATWGQCVVFFRRDFADSENTFQVKDDSIDTLNRRLTVELGSAANGRAPSGGDYIFGTWLAKPGRPVVHGRWYRIVSAVEVPQPTASGGPEYRLTLDRNWEGLIKPQNTPRVMLPSGVISVFDL